MPLLSLPLLHSQYSHAVVFPRVVSKRALTAGRLLRKICFNYLLFSAEGVLAVSWLWFFGRSSYNLISQYPACQLLLLEKWRRCKVIHCFSSQVATVWSPVTDALLCISLSEHCWNRSRRKSARSR